MQIKFWEKIVQLKQLKWGGGLKVVFIIQKEKAEKRLGLFNWMKEVEKIQVWVKPELEKFWNEIE